MRNHRPRLPYWRWGSLALLGALGLAVVGCLARQGTRASSTAKTKGPAAGEPEGLSRDEQQLFRASLVYPLADYLKDCEQALGVAPTLSCNDAVPYDYGVLERVGKELMCAHPTLNNPIHSCVAGTGVARYTVELERPGRVETVDWVMICSKVLPDPEPHRFHSIDVIGYNRSTGDTCFFKNAEIGTPRVSLEGQKVISADGSKLSRLSAEAVSSARTSSEVSWAMPFGTAGNCTSCHSNGPWLRSFVHRGLKGTDGKNLVPQRNARAGIEPYRIVGAERLRKASGDFLARDAHHTLRLDPRHQWDPRLLANPQVVNTCGTCHTVGNEHYCEINVKAAYGDVNSETAQVQEFSRRLITAEELAARKAGSSGSNPVVSAEAWHQRMHKAGPLADPAKLRAVLAEIRSCCDDPGKEGCQWLTPGEYKSRFGAPGNTP